MPSFVLGRDGKAYLSETLLTGSNQAAVITAATEVSNVKDLTINLTVATTDVTTRSGNGWAQNAVTIKDGTVTFAMQWQPADAMFTAVKDAFLGGTEIALFAADGPKATSGSQGILSNFYVSNFTRNENLLEAMMVDVELKPSSFTEWREIGA